MRTFLRDVRYAVRMLWASPGFTAAAIICLALGIGATSAIFSVVHAVLLKPLGYREPQGLIRIYTEFPTFPHGGLRRFWMSPPEYLDLVRDMHSWETLDAWVTDGVNLAGTAEPIRVTSTSVTGGLLGSLGVSPVIGRLITPQDDVPGASRVIVISSGLWQRAFAGDPSVIGRAIQVDGQNAGIVGVMPPGFSFPPGDLDPTELWQPLQLDPANPGGRGSHYLFILGRLKSNVSFRQAEQELAQMVRYSEETIAPTRHPFHHQYHPLVAYSFQDEVVREVRPALWTLLGAVAFVLLIACVNVANLLLARAEARQREIAIRKALGAGLPQLVRQFMVEGLLLALGGAGLGLALASAGLRLLITAGTASIPRAGEIRIDPTVLAVTFGVSVLTAVFFGLAPMAQLATGSLHDALKAASGRASATVASNRFRSALVAGELALALMLLIGAGLMLRAFWNLQSVHPGFRTDGLLTMRVVLPQAVYTTAASQQRFWQSVQEKIAAVPGVELATAMTGLPPERRINANDTFIEGFTPVPNGPRHNIDYWQVAGDRFAGPFDGCRVVR